MPLFDQEIMVRLITELRKSVARLRELSKLAEAEFLKDPDKIGSAKYHFIVTIECCIDMCNHLKGSSLRLTFVRKQRCYFNFSTIEGCSTSV